MHSICEAGYFIALAITENYLVDIYWKSVLGAGLIYYTAYHAKNNTHTNEKNKLVIEL